MAKVWPRPVPVQLNGSTFADHFEARHGGIASIARVADAAILMMTMLATDGLLETHDAHRARELVVAALAAVVVFVLHNAPGRYRLVRRMSRTRLAFRTCLPSFLLASFSFPLMLLILGQGLPLALRDGAVWSGLGLPALFIGRRIADRVLAHEGLTLRFSRRLVVVGEGQNAQRMAARLALDPLIKVTPILDIGDASAPAENLDRIVRECDFLDGMVRSVDGVVLALPYERRAEARRILLGMRRMHADLYADPALVADDLLQPLIQVGGCTLAVIQRRPLTAAQSFQKSMFDRAAGLAILIPMLPLILALMLVVRLGSTGPALFRQPRIGLHGRRFEIIKLRTMRFDQCDLLADHQTTLGDTRVTREGRWLRRFSLDELPQLFNVVRGEMSLVGPRPHAPNTRASGKLLNEALTEYVIRHQVKPGITGWAQINGARGQLETIEQLRRRVELDLEYMRRWSLTFDIWILLLTLYREILSKHAY